VISTFTRALWQAVIPLRAGGECGVEAAADRQAIRPHENGILSMSHGERTCEVR
jgi:hypothetical protein